MRFDFGILMYQRSDNYMKESKKILNRSQLSVFISAFNEESNIRLLLEHILRQKGDNFTLKEILVISDGSTDNTVAEVRKVNDSRIKLIDSKKRIGKSANLNYFFEHAKGEILILFDADIQLNSELTMSNLILPMQRDPRVGLVGGNPQPAKGRTFIENAVNLTCSVYQEVRISHRGGNNVFGADGRIMALSQKFAASVNVPDATIANDQFLYFSCISSRFRFIHEQSAVVTYRSPSTLSDQIRQNTRFIAAHTRMKRYFGSLVDKEYAIPRKFILPRKISSFFRKPIHALSIRSINIYCSLKARKEESKMNALWLIAPTTKELLYKK